MRLPPALSHLRRLWLGVALAVVVVVAVVVATADTVSTLPAALPYGLAAAAGLAALVGVRAVDRTFAAAPPADDDVALAELRTRAYLQLAIAEAPVLLGVALSFVFGPPGVAAAGGLFALAALALSRPTAGRVRAIEAAWHRAGHDVSLLPDPPRSQASA